MTVGEVNSFTLPKVKRVILTIAKTAASKTQLALIKWIAGQAHNDDS